MASRSGRRPWVARLGVPLVTGVAVGSSLLAGCAQGSSAGAADTVVSGSASASADVGASASATGLQSAGSQSAAPDSTAPVSSGLASTGPASTAESTRGTSMSAPSTVSAGPSGVAPTAGSAAPSPSRPATPSAGTHPPQQPGHNPLTGLPGVPAGFTLPPGYDVLKTKALDGGTEVLLTAPKVAVSIPYLRAELTRRGYEQVLQKKSGAITAWAYRKGSSIISVSGGVVDEVNATAVVFAKP